MSMGISLMPITRAKENNHEENFDDFAGGDAAGYRLQ